MHFPPAVLQRALNERIPPGVRYMVVAAFLFSVMSLFVKLIGPRIPSAQVVLIRNAFSLGATYWMLRQAGVRPWGTRRGLLVVRGAVGFVALLCFFYAIPRLPLADVTVIQFTNPVFTALLGAVFLGEYLKRREVALAVLSLLGVVLVAQPSILFGARAEALDPQAALIALAGAVLAAGAYITIRRLSATEHHLVIVFYFPLISVPAALPFLWFEAVWPTLTEWALLLGIGVLTQAAQISLTKGLRAERAGKAMSLSYVQILFAALWGFLFFGEVPDLLSVLGALLIVGSTVLLARS
ncbi:MAG: DMT family transporter [Bacteroidota bacterium]